MYGILDDEALSGTRAIERRLRTHRHARLVDSSDYGGAAGLIGRLCRCWGGVADLLVPITSGSPISEPYGALLDDSEIDSLAASPETASAAAPWGAVSPAAEYPSLLIAASRPRDRYLPIVVTAVPEEDLWHLSYAGCLGLLPEDGDRDLLDLAFANPELKIDDVLRIDRQEPAEPGLSDLLARVAGPTAVAASLIGLPPRPMRNSVYSTDGWLSERSAVARQTGSGIVVLYRPGSVADLCLLWNLRSLHGWPAGLPIGLPWPEGDPSAVETLAGQLGDLAARIVPGPLAQGPVLASASIPPAKVEELADEVRKRKGLQIEWATPVQLLVPANAPARTTGETVVFTNGNALVPTRSGRDHEWLEITSRLPRRPPLRLSVALRGGPLPTGRALRGNPFVGPRYLGGAYTTDGSRDELRNVAWPHKWTMLRAVAADHGLRVEASPAGRAAMALLQLIPDVREVRWLAHRPLLELLYRKAASNGMSWFKKRASELAALVADAQSDPEGARAEFQKSIDNINVSMDQESSGLLSFSEIQQTLSSRDAAAAWMHWAEDHHLIIRGAELACDWCLAKTWRPLADIAAATCPGCGQLSSRPFNESSLPFRFRLSEPLRRAIENDSIYHLLIMRYLIDLMSIRDDWLVGAHPGVDFYSGNGVQLGEADVLLLFSDGTTLLAEVKRHASGFTAGDLQRLETIADQMSGIGTVLGCGDDSATAGDQFAGLGREEPRPRRLITADQWLAPRARPVMGVPVGNEPHDWPGGANDENPADAFDRRFSEDIITARLLRKDAGDPVSDILRLHDGN
jgi:hypothetical protein